MPRVLSAEPSTDPAIRAPGFAVAKLGTEASVERLTHTFTARWANRAPATSNRDFDVLGGAARYWIDQGWITSDPTRRLRRRGSARRAPARCPAVTSSTSWLASALSSGSGHRAP